MVLHIPCPIETNEGQSRTVILRSKNESTHLGGHAVFFLQNLDQKKSPPPGSFPLPIPPSPIGSVNAYYMNAVKHPDEYG